MRELTIAPFQSNDRLELIEVIDQVCADTPWMQTRRFEPTLAWEHAMANEDCSDHLLAVAKVEGRVVGWCRLFPVEAQVGVVELGIGILSSGRRKGVGSALVGYGLKWARARSIAKVVLTTNAENSPAIGLFEKMGFGEREKIGAVLRMGIKIEE